MAFTFRAAISLLLLNLSLAAFAQSHSVTSTPVRAFTAEEESLRTLTAKTGALRQAALKLMRNPETNHPFYWAGFVLVGDGG